MKRVSVGEFAERAADYLACDEKVEIERDGRTVGFYVPIMVRPRDIPTESGSKPEAKEALDRLGQAVQRILDDTGLTEDELVDLFDLNKPSPDGPIGRPKATA
jgi:hypothetical protein